MYFIASGLHLNATLNSLRSELMRDELLKKCSSLPCARFYGAETRN